jgi:uncharacterized surface protein with fasciclin (FAS1) repeats
MTPGYLTGRTAAAVPERVTAEPDGLVQGRTGVRLARRSALAAGAGLLAAPFFMRAARAEMAMINAAQYDVGTVLASYPEFSTFFSILQQSGLSGEARGARNFTLFAPTNRAFAKYPNYYQTLIPGGSQMFPNTAKLILYIRNHVVAGEYPPDSFAGKKTTLTAISGATITVDGTGSGEPVVTYHLLNGQTITAALAEQPIQAANGLIYPINDPILGG